MTQIVWIGICTGGPFPHPGCLLYGSMGNNDDDDDDDDVSNVNIIPRIST
jgi:hypothetical protein